MNDIIMTALAIFSGIVILSCIYGACLFSKWFGDVLEGEQDG